MGEPVIARTLAEKSVLDAKLLEVLKLSNYVTGGVWVFALEVNELEVEVERAA